MDTCYFVEYDYLDYKKALMLQSQIRVIKETNREYDDFLMVLQHNPVFTLGKRGKREDIIVSDEILEKEGIEVIITDRGGKVTYHGPGQIVGYFLLDLIRAKLSIPDFVWGMEQTVIETIKHEMIIGFRREGFPGIWVKNNGIPAKIAAVGAKASKKITSHGLALNVNTNMNHFQMIIPCGIKEFTPMSMEQLIGKRLDMKEIYHFFEKAFETVFERKLIQLKSEKFEERIRENA